MLLIFCITAKLLPFQRITKSKGRISVSISWIITQVIVNCPRMIHKFMNHSWAIRVQLKAIQYIMSCFLYMASQLLLFLYSDGDMPTCSLKYLPRKLWLAKCRSSVICLMLFEVFFSRLRSSRVT